MCEASVKPTILHQKTLGLEYELPFYQGFVRLVPVKIACTHRVNIPICNNYRAPKQQNNTTTKFRLHSYCGSVDMVGGAMRAVGGGLDFLFFFWGVFFNFWLIGGVGRFLLENG